MVGGINSSKPGWSSWSEYGPCSSRCRKTRQRFCASANKDVDCPGQSYGVETEEVACSDQECKGERVIMGSVGIVCVKELRRFHPENAQVRWIGKIHDMFVSGRIESIP